jgi:hypothetical protein
MLKIFICIKFTVHSVYRYIVDRASESSVNIYSTISAASQVEILRHSYIWSGKICYSFIMKEVCMAYFTNVWIELSIYIHMGS